MVFISRIDVMFFVLINKVDMVGKLSKLKFLKNSKTIRRVWFYYNRLLIRLSKIGSDLPRGRFLTIRMDTNNKCNLRCNMCYFSMGESQKIPVRNMSIDLFKKIAEKSFPYTKRLFLSCSYEPLISPIFMEALDVVKDYNIPETIIVTNGVSLKRDNIEKIIEAGISQVHISIDAATKGTYEEVRACSGYYDLIEKIRLFNEIKQEKKVSLPRLCSDYTLMRSNIEELPAFVTLAAEINIESIDCRHLLPYAGLDNMDQMLFSHKVLTNRCLEQAHEIAKEKGVVLSTPDYYETDNGIGSNNSYQKNCLNPWENLFIRSDGETAPCCWFEGQVSVGSFEDANLSQIWNHDFYKKLRKEFTTGKLNPMCIYCLKDRTTYYRKEAFDVMQRIKKTYKL